MFIQNEVTTNKYKPNLSKFLKQCSVKESKSAKNFLKNLRKFTVVPKKTYRVSHEA